MGSRRTEVRTPGAYPFPDDIDFPDDLEVDPSVDGAAPLEYLRECSDAEIQQLLQINNLPARDKSQLGVEELASAD